MRSSTSRRGIPTIEKRQNNRTRRYLKFIIASGAIGGFGCAMLCVILQTSIVLAGMFATGAALSLAMLGPLASGESVSSNDVVQIVNAIRGMMSRSEDASKDQDQQRKRRR